MKIHRSKKLHIKELKLLNKNFEISQTDNNMFLLKSQIDDREYLCTVKDLIQLAKEFYKNFTILD